ncbi:hypothetical protein [Edaphobacter modestus]|nr:hypothetical protein [Edaphobacter modestus]
MRDFPNMDTNLNFRYTGTYPVHNAALQYIHVFSPVLVNEVRAGVNLRGLIASDMNSSNIRAKQ